MKKIVAMGMVVIMSLALAACGGDKAVAKINDVEIMQSQADQYYPLFAQGQFGVTDLSQFEKGSEVYEMIHTATIEDLVSLEVMKQYYDKAGKKDIVPETLDADFTEFYKSATENAQTKKFMDEYKISQEFLKDFFTKQFYVQTFYNEVSESLGDSEGKIKEYYNAHPEEFVVDEVKASHILVETEEKAKELREKALAGGDFAELAKANSIEPGATESGGSLGYFPRGKMVAEFETAAFDGKVGDITEPVKTSFGYHVIKIEDRKNTTKTLEEAHDQIYTDLFDVAYQAKLEEIKKSMEVKIYE